MFRFRCISSHASLLGFLEENQHLSLLPLSKLSGVTVKLLHKGSPLCKLKGQGEMSSAVCPVPTWGLEGHSCAQP